MQSSSIQNPMTQVPESPEMNDRDILSDALSSSKALSLGYVTAMNESSHDALYQMISGFLDDTSKQQRKFYDLMFQHGWYTLTAAQGSEISQVEQQYNTYKQKQLQ